MRFSIFQDSRQGDRKGNEDRVGYSYSRDVLLMAVADGMGGHIDGEVAAEIAITEITRRFQQEARNKLKKPFDFLTSSIQSAHRAIVSHVRSEVLAGRRGRALAREARAQMKRAFDRLERGLAGFGVKETL